MYLLFISCGFHNSEMVPSELPANAMGQDLPLPPFHSEDFKYVMYFDAQESVGVLNRQIRSTEISINNIIIL